MHAVRHISDDERRARLALRHAVAPWARVADPVAATRAMTVLHATEPPSVHLSVAARVDGPARRRRGARALRRPLPGQAAGDAAHAVRVPARPPARGLGGAQRPRGRSGAAQDRQGRRRGGHRRRRRGVARRGPRATLREVLAAVARRPARQGGPARRGRPRPQDRDVARHQVGRCGARSRRACWRGWARPATSCAAATPATGGSRGRPGRPWRPGSARCRQPLPEAEGYAELVRRWLWTFGPGTEADLVWWLGATKGAVRRALSRRGGRARSRSTVAAPAGCCPGTTRRPPTAEPWAALLPVLDPTTMGWRDRDWYLDPADTPYLFDSNGNGGHDRLVERAHRGLLGAGRGGPGGRGSARRAAHAPRRRRSPPRPSGSPPGSTA